MQQSIENTTILNNTDGICYKKDSCKLFQDVLSESNKLKEIFLFGSRKFEELNSKNAYLTEQINFANIIIKELKEENELLKKQLQKSEATCKILNKIAFGKKSEKNKDKSDKTEITTRGAVLGHKGNGRNIPGNLPIQEEIIDIPDNEKCCPCCGLPYEDMQTEEISYEIGVKKTYYLKKKKRKKYKKTCKCDKSIIITAPLPNKLIPKGKFEISFWVDVLINKFRNHLPLERQIADMAEFGLNVSSGTISRGFNKIHMLYIDDLYRAFIDEVRKAKHIHADETGWHVFVKIDKTTNKIANKNNFNRFVWIFATNDIVLLVVDATRSARVPLKILFDIETDDIRNVNKELLGAKVLKLLSVDKYSAYKALNRLGFVDLALCWTHERREFTDTKIKYPELSNWTDGWVARIGDLYHINNERVKYNMGDPIFKEYDSKLREKINKIYNLTGIEYSHTAQTAIMNSMKENWKGLTLFVEHPKIPMDNNLAERLLRPTVLGRKNYYGNHSEWGADLTVAMFSIIQTCLLNNISPRAFLTYYLEECAKRRSAPSENEIESFLPNKLSKEIKEKLIIIKPEISDDG